MNVQPGSAWWLLKHELRMYWYSSGLSGKRSEGASRKGKFMLVINVLFWVALHWMALLILGAKEFPAQMTPHLLVGVTMMYAIAFMLMLSNGLKSSVEVLFERGDLDLLLSSPLPSRSIFTVRLAGIVVGVAATFLYFLAPLANAGLMLGQFRWLGIYPAVFGASTVAASLAMLLTLGLVRLLGARRTRVVAQVVGAIAGAFLFLLSQFANLAPGGSKAAMAEWLSRALASNGALGSGSFLWLPARAALGAPLPMALVLLSALAVLMLTIYFTHRFFVHGLQQAASTNRAARRPAAGTRFNFNRSLWQLTLIKEWRLIARDAHLVSQVLLQLLYLLPLCVLIFSKGAAHLPALGAAVTFLCGSLTSSLGWIALLAEDAPDLLLASPANAGTIRLAKVAAAAIPPLAIVAAPLAWMVTRSPVAGLVGCATVTGAVASVALIVQWCGRPAARSGFRTRAKGNGTMHSLTMANQFAWAALAYLLLGIQPGQPLPGSVALGLAAACCAALALPPLAWIFRYRAS